uniref:Telomere repeats-binding bouquet formation protein 1 n=1 Tax=Pyxicephalus adspersus TaxID=30357 RepID=A0AAV2ZQX1_PYXAD|nr:TPA: hypothetical protein GDO54_002464 [Pyxicephalus adspersus]
MSTTLAHNMLLSVENTDPHFQLWLSVCSALCACVNNPQNEENQKLCTSAFPQADKWLQHAVHPEIVRPVCSLIGLSVANNRTVQDYFISVGGLDTLANILLQLVNGVQTKKLGCNLAVAVSKTLDACIAENSRAVHLLSKYNIVSNLITLLTSQSLNPEDKFSIVLTLAHCTEDCEPNQYELVKSNGLPLMIQVLTESQDDEIHKAATFILQNCRRITGMLSLSLDEYSLNVKQDINWNKPENCNDEFWENAKEIYQRIEHLQQHLDEDIADIKETEGSRERSLNQKCGVNTASAKFKLPVLNSHLKKQSSGANLACSNRTLKQSNNLPGKLLNNFSYAGNTNHRDSAPKEKAKQQIFQNTAAKHKSTASASGLSNKSDSDSYTAVRELQTGPMCGKKSCRSVSSRKDLSSKHTFTQTAEHRMTENSQDIFLQPRGGLLQEGKQTSPHGYSVCNSRANSTRKSSSISRATNIDPMILCTDIIDREISSFLDSQIPQAQERCSGCQVTAPSMNSRNCSNILQKCPYLCDRHRVIFQMEERHKDELRKLLHVARFPTLHNSLLLTPIRTGEQETQHSRPHGILLTPLRRRIQEEDQYSDNTECFPQIIKSDLDLEQSKGSPGNKQEIINNKLQSPRVQNIKNLSQVNSKRVARKDFTQKEITDLLDGVRRFGHHWNSILWSYPFQKGRSNVDLAKKYKQLQIQQGHEK